MHDGWSGFVYISDTVVEIFYKTPGMMEFRSTGFHDLIDEDTGRKLANRSISRPLTVKPLKFVIKYTDLAGNEQGPFEYVMDPKKETIRNTKSLLELIKNKWIFYRDGYHRRTIVYFSPLFREGVSEIHYGIDREAPDTKYDFQPFDSPGMAHYSDDAKIHMVVPDETEFISVQVTFKDGVKSDVLRFENPSPGPPEDVFPFADYAPLLGPISSHCFISGVAGSD